MIYLAHTSEETCKIINGVVHNQNKCKVLFLSPNHDKLVNWRSRLPDGNFEFIPIAKRLHQHSKSMKTSFLQIIGELAMEHDSPSWWGSRISERNTLINPLYLNCCYLELANSYIPQDDINLLILAEYDSLLKSLRNHFRTCELKHASISSVRKGTISNDLRAFLRIFAELLKLSLQCLKSWKMKGLFRRKRASKPCVILHTYFSPNNVEKDGSLKDIYFPGLREWFSKNGQSVVLLPVLSGFANRDDAYANFRRHGIEYIDPSTFLTPTDYIRAIFRFLRSMRLPKNSSVITLNSLDCTPLFQAAKRTFYPDLFPFFLYLDLFTKLDYIGYKPSAIISEFENMIPEKMLFLGARKAFPSAKLFAFQHGAIFPNFLCYSISDIELAKAPMPDKIICNGPFFKEQLAKDGFPPNLLILGPALRYMHIHENRELLSFDRRTKWDILCPLPLMANDCSELLRKVCKAFEKSDLKICIKPHPMVNPSIATELINEDFPDFEVFIAENQSVGGLIKNSKVVVGMASSTLLEAVCMGVEVISVCRASALNFNPLDYFPEVNQVAYDEKELKKMTFNALRRNSTELEYFQSYCNKIRKAFFCPTTDEAMKVFVA